MATKHLRSLGLILLTIAILAVVGGCRSGEETTVVAVGPKGDLADRIISPELTIGETASTTGLVEDTGALTLLTSYNWDEEGITREVFFLEPRLPELDGQLLSLTEATVTETNIYGYGIGLEGGSTAIVGSPTFTLPKELAEQLSTLNLDKLSKHPEHNGGYLPSTEDVAALAWTPVDVEDGEILYRSARLSLPPFADHQLTRWLQSYALTNEDGEPIRFYVGVRASFAE